MDKKTKNQFLKLVKESIDIDNISLKNNAYTLKEVKEILRDLKMDIQETAAFLVRNL